MSTLTDISAAMQSGRSKLVKQLVPQALEEGIPATDILNDALLSGMNIIGEKFKNNEVFVPEVLVAARAMNAGVEILKPYLAEAGAKSSIRQRYLLPTPPARAIAARKNRSIVPSPLK